jgi:hypothetical protein
MSRSDGIASLLGRYPKEVQAVAASTRELLKRALPGIDETLDGGGKLIGYRYGPGYIGLVCTLILSQRGVKLGIVRGATLADPMSLLTGRGKVHRHVPLNSVKDVSQPGLRPLLGEALAAWRTRNESAT